MAKKLYGTKKVFVPDIDLIAKDTVIEEDVAKDFVEEKNKRGEEMFKSTEIKSEVRYVRVENRITIEKVS